MKQLNQKGAIDLTFVLVLILLVGVGSLAYTKVQNSNPVKSRSTDTQLSQRAEPLPSELGTLKTLDEVKQIAGVTTDADIVELELEDEDGGLVYELTLRSGKTMKINASTGEIISQGTKVVSVDQLPATAQVTLTFAQAYEIAKSKSSSPITRFRLKVEDGRLVYRADYQDDSRVELDATSGEIVKQDLEDDEDDDNSSDDSSSDGDDSSNDSDVDDDDEDDDDDDDEDEDEDDDDDSSSNSGSGSNR